MFRFRLQRVLELRERKEKDAATALTSAQEAAEIAHAARAELEAARAELATQRGPAPSIGELRNLHFLLDRLDERVAVALSAVQAAEDSVTLRQDELRSAFQDRRTIDRLRERHHEAWKNAEVAQDRQLMDEIALTRFTGNAGGPGAAGTPDRTAPEGE